MRGAMWTVGNRSWDRRLWCPGKSTVFVHRVRVMYATTVPQAVSYGSHPSKSSKPASRQAYILADKQTPRESIVYLHRHTFTN